MNRVVAIIDTLFSAPTLWTDVQRAVSAQERQVIHPFAQRSPRFVHDVVRALGRNKGCDMLSLPVYVVCIEHEQGCALPQRVHPQQP